MKSNSEFETELHKVNKFINDLWLFIKKYYTADPDPSAIDWHAALAEAEALGVKYNARSGMLEANLINAVVDYLDGKEYEMRKGAWDV